jgi:glyoxalase family protein
VDFYTRVLGLRLVKRTVNFDDPDLFHLYYGDATGRPGTLLTFFARLNSASGRPGNRQATCVRFSVPLERLGSWQQRIAGAGVAVGNSPTWCGSPALSFRDPEGLSIQLVGAPHAAASANAILGLHSVELSVSDPAPTCALLTDLMGFEQGSAHGKRRRFSAAGQGPGLFVDVRADSGAPEGSMGAGCVHHVAFRSESAAPLHPWQYHLRQAGLDVTEMKDRKYFRSIYFQEPAGIRFEIATDGPGFDVDEAPHELGRRLQLPAVLEPMRQVLEGRLGALEGPTASA